MNIIKHHLHICRRCCNSVQDQKLMRGRNTLTFLIVVNLAVYIMETLLIRSYEYQADMSAMFDDVFGK